MMHSYCTMVNAWLRSLLIVFTNTLTEPFDAIGQQGQLRGTDGRAAVRSAMPVTRRQSARVSAVTGSRIAAACDCHAVSVR